MDGDTLIFAAIFMIAIMGLCGGVVLLALSRVSSASQALRHRRAGVPHSPTRHRAYRDVV